MSVLRREIRRARTSHRCGGPCWTGYCHGDGRIHPGDLHLSHVELEHPRLGERPQLLQVRLCRACVLAWPDGEASWACLTETRFTPPAAPDVLQVRRDRAERANRLILAVASCGHRYFDHTARGGQVSSLQVADTGTVFLKDGRSGARIDTRTPGRWKGFSEGGTLRQLAEELARFVQGGTRLPAHRFRTEPDWLDRWNYGEAMRDVRAAAEAEDLLEPQVSGTNARVAPQVRPHAD